LQEIEWPHEESVATFKGKVAAELNIGEAVRFIFVDLDGHRVAEIM